MVFAKIKKDKSILFIQIMCALLIINYHTTILDIQYLSLIAKGGFILNTIFIFFSGYLLSLSFSNFKNMTFFKFMINRIKRIYPSLIVVLLITLFYSLITSKQIFIYNYLKWFSGFGYFFYNNEIFSNSHLWFISVILVCYILFIPSYKIISTKPFLFITFVWTIILIYNYLFSENTLAIYNNISSDKILRFLYHYLIFIISIFWQTKGYNIKRFNYMQLVTFILAFIAYIFFIKSNSYSIFSVILVIPILLSLIPIFYSIVTKLGEKLPIIINLGSIPYELYLIHYLIINSLNEHLHGKIISYPLTFIITILLAFLIHYSSYQFKISIEKLHTTKISLNLANRGKY